MILCYRVKINLKLERLICDVEGLKIYYLCLYKVNVAYEKKDMKNIK